MAKKDNTKSLEAGLWEACNSLRGSVNPFEYMQVVFGLLFLRFATEKFNIQREKLINDGDEDFLETPSFYLQDNVFFMPEDSRWDYISKNAKQSDIAIKIDNALQILEDSNEALVGCLPK
ncbi:MAG: type I restriction-modification system subunit M N-terminal domain-containing protein, partial [Eubacteriales bacterium]|nr:type I restriction-modification system subunit M N-terminal domain-containing protein [Eubacteriales bacterium]